MVLKVTEETKKLSFLEKSTNFKLEILNFKLKELLWGALFIIRFQQSRPLS
jgi:hypothetical protein